MMIVYSRPAIAFAPPVLIKSPTISFNFCHTFLSHPIRTKPGFNPTHRSCVLSPLKCSLNEEPTSSHQTDPRNNNSNNNNNNNDSGKNQFGMGVIYPAYAALFALQILPLVTMDYYVNALYFLGTASLTLFIGCKRSPFEDLEEDIGLLSSVSAPIAASAFLFGSYWLLKNTEFNIQTVFRLASTGIGALCLKDAIEPVVFSALPESIRTKSLGFAHLKRKSLPLDNTSDENAAFQTKIEEPVHEGSDLSSLIAFSFSLIVTALYATNQQPNFFFSNLLCWGIGARYLSLLKPSSYLAAAGLLLGLFFYDCFFVFGTDVMVTVATTLEAPAKFLFPKDPAMIANAVVKYPYSVLGLGDIVVPGIFVNIMLILDKELVFGRPSDDRSHVPTGPYFRSAFLGYFGGLILTFVANNVTNHPQPALFYLVPSLILSSILTAASRSEIRTLISYKRKDKEQQENSN